MFTIIVAKQHARRVAAHLRSPEGLIYLESEPTKYFEDSDMGPEFRQRRYYYYLTGSDDADCYVTYDIREDELTLYIPDFDLDRAIWLGPSITKEEALAR